MNITEKMEFPRLVRQLRIDKGLKQRQVAEHLHMAVSSYGNVEANNHKTMSLDRVHRLCRLYGLPAADTDPAAITVARMVAAWEALPASEFSERNQPGRQRRAVLRSKVRGFDAMRAALLGVTTLLISSAPDPDTLCACSEDDILADGAESGEQSNVCEVCAALRLLGVPKWTTKEAVIAELAKIQEAS